MKASFDAAGDVREVDLLAAFVELWRSRAAGVVSFSRAGASSAFAVTDGDVVSISSSEARFESSAILIRAGKLDAAALERLGVPEGADGALAALQAGILTRREWRWGEKIRGIEVLADLLGWPDGRYDFDREARPAAGEFSVAIPRLLLELFLRSRDRNLIEHQLGPSDATLVRTEDFDAEFSTFGLTADAESVVRMIDGKATADEIARGAPADEFAVRKLLAALKTLGLLRSEAGRAQAAEAAGPAQGGDPEGLAAARLDAGAMEPDEPGEVPSPPAGETEIPPRSEPQERTSEERGAGPGARAAFAESGLASALTLPQTSEFDLDPAPPSALETFPLPGATGAGETRTGSRGPSADPLYEPIPADGDTVARPHAPGPRGGGPLLVWVIVALALLTAVILFLRSRSAARGTAGEPAPVTPAASAPGPTAVAALVPTSAPPAVATMPSRATALPPAATPRPAPTAKPAPTSARAAGGRATPSASVAPPTPPAVNGSAGRAEWLARAGRDRARLKSGRGTRYAVQLELACEVPSLAEAWRHDRPPGSMWLLAGRHGTRECFRVLWGRFRTLEDARKARSGIPAFFSTPFNHPAIVPVP